MSSTNLSFLIVSMAASGALFIWGLISAKMQVRPRRMFLLGLAATVCGAIQQFNLSLPVSAINNHSSATNLILQLREVSSVVVSVLLSMGGAVLGAAVALKAARLYAVESESLRSRLEDAELDIQELNAKIATIPESSKEERDWWVHERVVAAARLRELENEAKRLDFPPKRHKRHFAIQPSSVDQSDS